MNQTMKLVTREHEGQKAIQHLHTKIVPVQLPWCDDRKLDPQVRGRPTILGDYSTTRGGSCAPRVQRALRYCDPHFRAACGMSLRMVGVFRAHCVHHASDRFPRTSCINIPFHSNAVCHVPACMDKRTTIQLYRLYCLTPRLHNGVFSSRPGISTQQ